MEPTTMALLAGGSAVSNILGGILGGSAASEQAEKAQALLDAAIRRIDALEIPDLTKKIIYEQFVSVGDFTPQRLEKTIEETAPLALIKESPENKARQEAIYAQVQQASLTGLGAQDKLALEQSRRKAAQDALAQMATIKSEAQRRGQLGGGAALALQGQAAQAAADRQSAENMQIAAQAEQNRQAQLNALFGMATGMRGTELQKEMQNVQARNLRDEMMMKYASARELQNKQWQEEANRARRQQEQEVSRANVALSQQEALRQGYTAPLEMARMRMDKEKAIAGLMGGKAGTLMDLGKAKAQAWSDIGAGVGRGISAYGGWMSDYDKTNATKDLANAIRSSGGSSAFDIAQPGEGLGTYHSKWFGNIGE